MTGASGFVGRHLCARLASSDGPVRAIVRREAGGWPAGVEPRLVADLLDRHALGAAVAGCDTLVHLAGRAHVLRDRAADPAAEFYRDNVEGTRAVFDAATAAGVRTFVLMSSVAAVAGPAAGFLADAPLERPTTPYGESKLAAERFVRREAEARGLRAVVLRPPMVYGPGMKGNPLRLFRLVERGVPLPLGAVRNRRSALYVGNLVDAVAAALVEPRLAGGAHFVTDGEALSTPDFVRRSARALGRAARLVPFPPRALRALGAAGDRLARLLATPLTSATVDSLTGTLVLDDAPFRELAGWHPRHSVDDALGRTAAWYLGGATR